jgi:hypothetical protein
MRDAMSDDGESLADLERKMRQKTDTIRRLLRERDQVTSKRNEIDEQLQKLSGKTVEQLLEEFNEDFVEGGDAVREVFDLADRLLEQQKRPNRPKSITEYILEVLAKTPGLKPRDITQRVIDSGYETDKQNFGDTIGVYLSRMKTAKQIASVDGFYYLFKDAPKKRRK